MAQPADDLREISNPLDAQLEELAEAYRDWKFPLDQHRRNKANIGPDYTIEEYWQDYRKIQQELLRVRDLFEELYCVLERVCRDYQHAGYAERNQIRQNFQKSDRYDELLWMFIADCTKRIKSPENEDFVRLALLAISIQNCSLDYRDTLSALASVYVRAESHGIPAQPIFDEVAEVTTDKPTQGGCDHLATSFRQIGNYAVVAELRQNLLND